MPLGVREAQRHDASETATAVQHGFTALMNESEGRNGRRYGAILGSACWRRPNRSPQVEANHGFVQTRRVSVGDELGASDR
jgi:hypothetical protein